MEVRRDLRRGAIARVVKSGLLAALLVACYTVAIFLVSVDEAMSQGLSPDAEREMISVTDTLDNPDEFAETAGSLQGYQAVARFYDQLTSLPSGTFLSAFDQQLPVEAFKGGKGFFAPMGEEQVAPAFKHPATGTTFQAVRSIQLNEAAWTFYGLSVDAGAGVDWAQVDYEAKAVPVVLGAAYQGRYEVGDTMTADLYGRIVTLEVAGILQPRSYLYYKGDLNYSLDSSVLLPYPPSVPAAPPEETERFYSILTFAMIAGDIAVDQDSSIPQVRREIELASQRSQFPTYAILGAPGYLTQYTLVRDIVMENRSLILALLSMVAAAAVIAAAWTNRRTAQQRRGWSQALWVLGHPRTTVAHVVLMSGLAYASLTVVLVGIGVGRLPGQNPQALVALIGVLTLVVVADLVHELRLVRQTIDQTGENSA